jgi:hypothetical protein
MRGRAFLVFSALTVLAAALSGGCIYTSNVVFPTNDTALYCFYDDSTKSSYLYRIDLNKRRAELIEQFEQPVFAISLSQDREALLYYELFESMDSGDGDEKVDDTLTLNRIGADDLADYTKAELIRSFKVNGEAGTVFASSFGAARIAPSSDNKGAFVNYVEDENLIVLCKVDFETGGVTVIDRGIVLYPKLSPNGKYLGYVKGEKVKKEGEDDEGFLSALVVVEIEEMKRVETRDVGKWKVPPQFDFHPGKRDGYEVLYPTLDVTSGKRVPEGVSMRSHYVDSLQYIAGTNRLSIYGLSQKEGQNLIEVTSLDSDIIQTFHRGDFVPLTWSPDDRFFFLGKDEYLAQYIAAKKIFALYEFIPPEADSEKPKVYSSLVKTLPK